MASIHDQLDDCRVIARKVLSDLDMIDKLQRGDPLKDAHETLREVRNLGASIDHLSDIQHDLSVRCVGLCLIADAPKAGA